VIWRLDGDGGLRRAALIELPVASLMHDFAVTRTKIVLLLPPLLMSAEGGRALVDRYAWQGEEPLRVLVLDKEDLSQRRLYELPARFLFHVGNAWEDASGAIRVDAFLFQDSTFASQGTRDLPQGRYVEPPNARPTLITLHADGRAETAVLEGAGEFPRIDPRRIGLEHRCTYGIVGFGIGRWDWRSGRHDAHIYSPHHWSEEPVFVPRPNRSGEREGWIVASALNTQAQRTELNIFDARGIEDGPIAQFACPYKLPLGFHGAFVQS
jgi:all-trans-8'-apo-beta-carotenal 15,15'-oxygenase